LSISTSIIRLNYFDTLPDETPTKVSSVDQIKNSLKVMAGSAFNRYETISRRNSMDDIRAVVNDFGVVLHVNFATDKNTRDDLLAELGGVHCLPMPDRIPIRYGNGLTKDLARTILKRRGVPFDET
jgi:hypothetical protein